MKRLFLVIMVLVLTISFSMTPFAAGSQTTAGAKITLLDEKFYDDKASAGWEKRAFEVRNMIRKPLDPAAKSSLEKAPVIYNGGGTNDQNKTKAGYVTYKFNLKNAVDTLKLNWRGRKIPNDPKAYVKVYLSKDNKKWTLMHSMPERFDFAQEITEDLTKYTKGLKTFYIKFEVFTTTWSWASIRSIKLEATSK